MFKEFGRMQETKMIYSSSGMVSITENTYAKQPNRINDPCDRIAEPSHPFSNGGYTLHLQFGRSGAAILFENDKK